MGRRREKREREGCDGNQNSTPWRLISRRFRGVLQPSAFVLPSLFCDSPVSGSAAPISSLRFGVGEASFTLKERVEREREKKKGEKREERSGKSNQIERSCERAPCVVCVQWVYLYFEKENRKKKKKKQGKKRC